MLLHMHINNIVLIDDLNIDFDDGLNILTGETGAGKSIIIGSLGIGLGGRFSKDLLRDSDKDGLVELLFTVDDEVLADRISSNDVDVSDGELLISRRLTSSGKTINKINDNTVTTAKLKDITALLIDLHAQHEQQSLLKVPKHLAILDDFGKAAIYDAKKKVAELYHEYRDIRDELDSESMNEDERIREQDFLKYQISEIKAANLKEGEDALLETGYRKAVNSKEILLLANEIYEATGYNSSGAGDMIGRAAGNMRRIAELDEDARDACNTLIDVDGMLNDFNSELNRYMKSVEFDEQSFDELEERLNLINLLKSKYGRTITDILNTLKNFEEQYKKLISYDEYMYDLKIRFDIITQELTKASNELTDIRKKEAEKLCKVVKKALEELNFMTVAFDMEWRKLSDYTANGNDEAYFVISTNVGEPMRPLYEVASGGELSRVMLAIKSSIANRDDTPTLIFDEIDVGISGRTAQKVAEKLSVIGRTHQVICITHLPQIAAMADSHYSIEKNVVNNKTVTNIRKLVNEEEINEIARLLGGAQITDSTIASAREMKQLADKAKIN